VRLVALVRDAVGPGSGASARIRLPPCRSRCLCGPLTDLPSTCGGHGMYLAIWHRDHGTDAGGRSNIGVTCALTPPKIGDAVRLAQGGTARCHRLAAGVAREAKSRDHSTGRRHSLGLMSEGGIDPIPPRQQVDEELCLRFA
jgi:hypothetical protein